MSLAELMVVFLVALLVFGPSQLSKFGGHLAWVVAKYRKLKEQSSQLWREQLNQWQLLDNEKKAAEADQQYQSSQSSVSRSTKE